MRIVITALLALASSLAWASDYGKLPMSFEANRGQTGGGVRFVAHSRGETIFLTATGAVVRSGKDVLRMELEGDNPSARVTGVDELPGKSNYLIGNDPALWHTNVPTFAKVRYGDVYPGIDLVFYGNEHNLEYDFLVAPGMDPNTIRFAISGTGKLSPTQDGGLALGALRLHRPVVYQQIDGQRKSIDGRFVVQGRHVRFKIARYDHTRPLVIDPVLTLTYSTYLGGSGGDQGMGIAVDSSGNAYITGFTDSSNFPTVSPEQVRFGGGSCPLAACDDVFIAKLNPAGNALVYSTYLGGNDEDKGLGIAVDATGNVYLTGFTQSSNFPTTAGAFETKFVGSTFVAKLNASGSGLIYSTYLNYSRAAAIAIDSTGNAYVTGSTQSGLPVTAGVFQSDSPGGGDGFVAKLNPTGSALVYCTYLGGQFGDSGTGIAVDSAGNAYVTGVTSSTDFPVKNAYQPKLANSGGTPDAFVTALNPTGSALIYSTYLGGSAFENGGGIALDSAANAYISGSTNSQDLPTTTGAFEPPILSGGSYEGFVAKFQANGTMLYSTYLGSGLGGAYSYGIAADSAGNAYVTGGATATFPTQDPFQAEPGGNSGNVFVTKINSTGSALIYSTFLGGSGGPSGFGDTGYAIAVDSKGNAYVTGGETSNNFPTVNAVQSKFGGLGGGNNAYGDAFVAKVAAFPASVTPPTISSVVNGASFQPGIVPGSWATILGAGLSVLTDNWNNSIVNGRLPTSVDGVSVTVGGQPAYVYFISASQINFIVPPVPAGPQPVVVTNAAGSSSPVTATAAPFGPAFFGWPNSQPVATRQDFTLAVANGTFPGATTTAAKPGDVLILWGTGFGPTNPNPPQGFETPGSATFSTNTLPTVTINNLPATVYGAALAPGFAGLYQVAIQVPTALGNGNWPIMAAIGGTSSPTGLVLAVQQ